MNIELAAVPRADENRINARKPAWRYEKTKTNKQTHFEVKMDSMRAKPQADQWRPTHTVSEKSLWASRERIEQVGVKSRSQRVDT